MDVCDRDNRDDSPVFNDKSQARLNRAVGGRMRCSCLL